MNSLKSKSERILGGLILGGAADALGWRNETATQSSRRKPVTRLESWNKRIGRVGGHWEGVEAGEYSDDTQLTLAVARCISASGEYDPDRFVKVELPYWLSYQRGAGRTVKAAARNALLHKDASWHDNVFPGYYEAGANGAAMRVLALATIEDVDKMALAVWQNALATHGHPRAIVGALVMAYALHHTLRVKTFSPAKYIQAIKDFLASENVRAEQEEIAQWMIKAGERQFRHSYEKARREMEDFLNFVHAEENSQKEEVLDGLGCYRSSTRGSGTATVAAANYFFLKYYENPIEGILEAANSLGTDTDTIGKFCGNLLGSLHGRSAYENRLTERLQDRFYFLRTAGYLVGEESAHWDNPEMDETDLSGTQKEGDPFSSRIFGAGVITRAPALKIVDRGKALLHQARVQFLCGLTCVFSKKVERNGRPTSGDVHSKSLFQPDES